METQFIKLNMTPTGINPCFHVSQYDIGRSLGFIVYNGSEVVDLDSYTCTIEATRSDGVAITASVTTDDNVGTFETTATMTNKADKYKAQFIIVDGDSNRIASLPFDMEVIKAAMDENAESIEEDASLYQQYTEAVQGAIAEVNADIQAEENARIAAVSAEATARANADTTLQNNIDAEATARTNADATLQGNINSEASTRASADSNLQAQINQIIAPSGEAPSAAEVENARVGADGTTYASLGTAIRTQATNLKNLIDLIFNAKTPTFTDGYTINHSTHAVQTHFHYTITDFLDCGKDSVIILDDFFTTSDYDACAFFTEGRTYISGINNINGNTIITNIPDETAYVRLSSRKTNNEEHKAIIINSNFNGLIATSNYATKLADLNYAFINSFYILNFAANSSMPLHMPDTTKSYSLALLATFGQTYKTQYLLNDGLLYSRKLLNSWTDWTLMLDMASNIQLKGLVESYNYSSILPDLNNATLNGCYLLNFAANSSMPNNMPATNVAYNVAPLFTFGGAYKTQLLFTRFAIYKRDYGYNWESWTTLCDNNRIVATPKTLIGLMKQYAKTGKRIILSNEEYDVYEMYKDYYGSDYWTNYTGYRGETDPFTRGLWLDTLTLEGSGDTEFTFSGEATQAIQSYFAIFALTGESSIKNVKVSFGDGKLRYAIHDDFAEQYSKLHYEGIIFKGTPVSPGVIGAGFGIGCSYRIENCIFENNDSNFDISYHSSSVGTIPCTIIVDGCKGYKDCAFRWYGSGTEKNICIVSNSDFRSIYASAHEEAPHDVENIELIKYLCNEVNEVPPSPTGYVHFTVPVNRTIIDTSSTANELTDSEDIDNVDCVIKFPTSYSVNGTPSKLLMICHGAGGGTMADNPTNWPSNQNYNKLVNAFLANGYVVFDCHGYGNNKNDFNVWGSPVGVQTWRKAYDYIVNTFNVEKDISIYGFSMGGLTALNLVINNFPNVKCVALGSPVIDLARVWASDQARAELILAYGRSTWNQDLYAGNNPMDNLYTENGVDYFKKQLPPIEIWYGGTEESDSFVDKRVASKFVQAIRNSGGTAWYREVVGTGHEICAGANDNVNTEIVYWINRFNN